MSTKKKGFDPYLNFWAIIATTVGIVTIFSAGFARSINEGKGPISSEFRMQIIMAIVSIGISALVATVPIQTWRKLVPTIFIASLLLLLSVKVIGVEMNGATRWIKIGPALIQPAEFMKVASLMFLAMVLSSRTAWKGPKKRPRDWAEQLDKVIVPKLMRFGPAFILLIAIVCIEREPDLGTAAVVGASAFLMYLYAGVTKNSAIAVSLVAVLGVAYMIKNEAYRMERITTHFSRWDKHNVDDIGYQTTQSELAMATGGFASANLGAGRAKHMIPAATTDYVMATVAEETGFLGVLAYLAIIGAVIFRLYSMAIRCTSKFSHYLCMGVAVWLTVQTSVNLMMANGTLPSIGIPFPFISSGGSNLIAIWIALGLCQSAVAETQTQEVGHKTRNHGRRNWRSRFSRA